MSDPVLAVTGAFGVVGAAVVRAAAGAGWRVAAIDRAAAPSDHGAALALGGVDLTDGAQAAGAIQRIRAELGGLDALANIAGGFVWSENADSDGETWRKMFAINLATAANVSKAALEPLAASGRGAIVNIGAFAALNRAAAGMGPYTASKAGVHKLTESLAAEQRGKITVNALLPSIVDTPANRADMPKAKFDEWVAPEEIAAAILFLISPQARAITGALIPIVGRVA